MYFVYGFISGGSNSPSLMRTRNSLLTASITVASVIRPCWIENSYYSCTAGCMCVIPEACRADTPLRQLALCWRTHCLLRLHLPDKSQHSQPLLLWLLSSLCSGEHSLCSLKKREVRREEGWRVKNIREKCREYEHVGKLSLNGHMTSHDHYCVTHSSHSFSNVVKDIKDIVQVPIF